MPIIYAAAHQSGQGLELYYPHGNAVDIAIEQESKVSVLKQSNFWQRTQNLIIVSLAL